MILKRNSNAIRRGVEFSPTGDIEQINREIEQGYQA
jgi:hypothetical protein